MKAKRLVWLAFAAAASCASPSEKDPVETPDAAAPLAGKAGTGAAGKSGGGGAGAAGSSAAGKAGSPAGGSGGSGGTGGTPVDAAVPMDTAAVTPKDTAEVPMDTAPLKPTFTNVFAIFDQKNVMPGFARCGKDNECHVRSNNAEGGLFLGEKAAAYQNIINVDGKCGKKIVVPGKPGDSILSLIVKGPVSGCADLKTQMPKGRVALSAEQIALIDAWITAGAKND